MQWPGCTRHRFSQYNFAHIGSAALTDAWFALSILALPNKLKNTL
jgi:hypothetical protein